MIFVYLVRKRFRTQNNEYVIKRFSTFFIEFKEEGPIYSMFYILYIARRVIIASCFILLDDGVLQLCLIMGFSFIVNFIQIPLYVAYTRCFKINVQNFYHFANEVTISLFYCLMFVSALINGNEMTEKFAYGGIYLIMIAWGLNICSSLWMTGMNILEKLKNCRKKKKVTAINTNAMNFTAENKINSEVND